MAVLLAGEGADGGGVARATAEPLRLSSASLREAVVARASLDGVFLPAGIGAATGAEILLPAAIKRCRQRMRSPDLLVPTRRSKRRGPGPSKTEVSRARSRLLGDHWSMACQARGPGSCRGLSQMQENTMYTRMLGGGGGLVLFGLSCCLRNSTAWLWFWRLGRQRKGSAVHTVGLGPRRGSCGPTTSRGKSRTVVRGRGGRGRGS